jgi:hypothetical protein
VRTACALSLYPKGGHNGPPPAPGSHTRTLCERGMTGTSASPAGETRQRTWCRPRRMAAACTGRPQTSVAPSMSAGQRVRRRALARGGRGTTSTWAGSGPTSAWYRKTRSSRPLCTARGPRAVRTARQMACSASVWSPTSSSKGRCDAVEGSRAARTPAGTNGMPARTRWFQSKPCSARKTSVDGLTIKSVWPSAYERRATQGARGARCVCGGVRAEPTAGRPG